MKNNLTVITDPGIDDLIALVLLYKLSPNPHTLISTFGNAPEEITGNNTQEFIKFIAPSWQYGHGSSVPYNGTVEHPWPDYFHGPDGVWNVHPQVDISSITSVHTPSLPSQVISLATLTDLLKIQRLQEPSEIIIMGGVFSEAGNETEYAETNIAFDAEAAHYFFNSISNSIVHIVPLDVTRKAFWTEEKVVSIPETNPSNAWLKKLLLTWYQKYHHEREQYFNLHDPLAVYLKFFPNQARWIHSGVDVITKGIKRGQTTFNPKNTPCFVALDLLNPSTISEQIYQKVFL